MGSRTTMPTSQRPGKMENNSGELNSWEVFDSTHINVEQIAPPPAGVQGEFFAAKLVCVLAQKHVGRRSILLATIARAFQSKLGTDCKHEPFR